jgi:hypothetical protein
MGEIGSITKLPGLFGKRAVICITQNNVYAILKGVAGVICVTKKPAQPKTTRTTTLEIRP